MYCVLVRSRLLKLTKFSLITFTLYFGLGVKHPKHCAIVMVLMQLVMMVMMMMMMMMAGDDELVSSLLFDAEATRGVVSDWRKENSDAALNHSPKNKSV